ncbi:hypothetical protein SAMN02744133_106146 [Thalassospira xiamenensis M-5 = DSM 17429]|nr:hypothetical protein SAMN02744133_106146 [Thalassospira xiamenensis M-5 = DSM 17429]
MTDLSACSNGPPARRQPIQSQQAKPAALGCPKTHLTPRATALPNGRHTNPAIDDQPFGTSERTTSPLATDPASRSPPATPATRPVDPVPIQSGRNSGPLILGIVTLHRPDWTKRTGRTSPRPSYRCPEPTPLPQGHISPVMINTRFSQISDGLTARTHHRHNDFSMRQRCSFGDATPAMSSRQIAALSSSHSCFCRPKRKKPAKANHALRVLSPDPFVLLTLSLCHKEKNKSRTFFSKKRKKFPVKAQYSEKTIFINALGMIILFPRQSLHRKRSPNRAPFVVVYPGQSAAQFGNLVSGFLCQAGDGGPVTGLDRVLGSNP